MREQETAYADRARAAEAEAAAETLEHVRQKHLDAAAAWHSLATLAEKTNAIHGPTIR